MLSRSPKVLSDPGDGAADLGHPTLAACDVAHPVTVGAGKQVIKNFLLGKWA
jgi:hypothetical protein